MKSSAIFILILMTSCNAQKGSETIYAKYDTNGKLIEKWGNENKWDNDVNFREFYFYSEEGKLIRKLYYAFEDDNKECRISTSDSMRYTEFRFVYNNNSLLLEQRFDPVLNENDDVIDHKITYVYNHRQKREDITSPTYQK